MTTGNGRPPKQKPSPPPGPKASTDGEGRDDGNGGSGGGGSGGGGSGGGGSGGDEFDPGHRQPADTALEGETLEYERATDRQRLDVGKAVLVGSSVAFTLLLVLVLCSFPDLKDISDATLETRGFLALVAAKGIIVSSALGVLGVAFKAGQTMMEPARLRVQLANARVQLAAAKKGVALDSGDGASDVGVVAAILRALAGGAQK